VFFPDHSLRVRFARLRLRTDAEPAPCASSWRVVSGLVPAARGPGTPPHARLAGPENAAGRRRRPRAPAVRGGRGGESSRSAWYVSTDMCVCRANCEPLSVYKLAPSPSCERASHAPVRPPPRLYPLCRLTVVTPPRSSSSARVGSASRATIKSGRPQSALTWEVVLLAVDHHRTSPEAAFYGLCKLPTIASEHVGSLFVQRIVGIRLQHQKLQPHDDR